MRTLLSTFILALAFSFMFTGASSAAGFNSELNHPSYWGDNCVKFENFTDNDYNYSTSNDDTTKVIIKASTKVAIYDDGDFTNLSSPINEKNGKPFAISHVIECYGETEDPDCEDEIYFQDNIRECDPEEPEEPEDPKDPEDPEDEPEVLSETDGKGGQEILAETGAETVIASALAMITAGAAYASIGLSKDEIEEIAL